jgi:hypothetical protein
MADGQDAVYNGVRAGEERRLAESTDDAGASDIHADLAARYQALSLDPTLVEPAIRNSGGGSDEDTLDTNVC